MTETEAFAAEIFKELDRHFEYPRDKTHPLNQEWSSYFGNEDEFGERKRAVLDLLKTTINEWRRRD